MSRWNVIVLAFEGDESLAQEIRLGLSNGWPVEPRATFTVNLASRVTDDLVRSFDAAVLVIDQFVSESAVLRLLGMFEEAGVAVLSLVEASSPLRDPLELAGALVEKLDEPLAILCAKLHGILHQQRAIERLRDEVAIAQRFQGGMKGEMDRIHDELQLAANVQRELLPRQIPSIHGIEIAALWRPVNYVSGDIYDVRRLDEDHVGVFLADAVGHGVPAALMTMVLCQSLESKHIEGAGYRLLQPSEVLENLNRTMIERQGSSTRFATAVYLLINCRSRVAHLAGAGHPPPILLKHDGGCRELNTSGGLLGVFADETYEQIEFELELDDRLLLYSDGFEQAFPSTNSQPIDRRIPTTRYRAEFQRLREPSSAAAMVERISERLDHQRGSLHQIDDLSLICVRAAPVPQETSGGDPARDAAHGAQGVATPAR